MEFARRRAMTAGPAQAAFSDDATTNVDGGTVLARRLSATIPHARREDPAFTVKRIYEENARFVWLTLQRLGVQPPDLGDVAHDVFVVVHRRLDSFDRTSRVTTWLFGICMRVAANYRRRRRVLPSEAVIHAGATDDSADQIAVDEMLARRQERAAAEQVLAELSLEKRAVFVMFEVEDLSCPEIAELMGVPIGTVYSRLHAARTEVQRIVSRETIGKKTNVPKK